MCIRDRKQKAAQKKKAKRTQIKEMKFRPGTDEGDYQVKLRNLVRFLENGDKAKSHSAIAGVRWLTKNSVWKFSSVLRVTSASWVLLNSFQKWKVVS